MAEPPNASEVIRMVPAVSETEAAALVDWYATLARGLAAFPTADLKGVEPPLQSTPGPHA